MVLPRNATPPRPPWVRFIILRCLIRLGCSISGLLARVAYLKRQTETLSHSSVLGGAGGVGGRGGVGAGRDGGVGAAGCGASVADPAAPRGRISPESSPGSNTPPRE